MANRLKMADYQAIIGLWRQGWSWRRIAAAVGVDRGTVARHVQSAAAGVEGAERLPGTGATGRPLDIAIISRQLGHTSITTTARYLDHIAPTAVMDAMQGRAWMPA